MRGGENSGAHGFFVLASFAVVAALLYFAKAVFIPVAVALLFTFLLSPLVARLQRWKFPKPIAVVVTASIAFSVVAFIGWLVATQMLALADELPKYEQNLYAKVRNLKGPSEPGSLSRAAEIIKGVGRDLEESTARTDETQPGTSEKPIAVEVKAPKPSVWQVARNLLGPLLAPIGTAGIVVILVLAMLFKREDLRDRFIKVVSRGRLNLATEAVDDAGHRISRYLLMLLVVNVTYGIPIGVGLYFIGVPNALLWGLLATLLRFIPFLGPWIAAAFPLAMAFAVDPGWSKVLMTVALFITAELISNNLVEPWLYGAGTGVSVVAVIGGAIFWTWLWGPVGLFMATPLTVCLVVMGKYVPGLRFLHDMFGSDPVLEPPARLYQRMLAMDSEEMLRQAEEFLEQKDLSTFYDRVFIPALILAEEDRQTGALAEVRQKFIYQSSRELIEELGEREFSRTGRTVPHGGPAVLCLPASDDADELVALMLAQLLQLNGIPTRLVSATATAEDWQVDIRNGRARAVCVSALPPSALTPARRVARRLKQTSPSLKVVVGLWTPIGGVTDITARLANARVDGVATTLRDALPQLLTEDVPEVSPPVPGAARPQPIPLTFMRSQDTEELLQAVKRQVAKTFDVPMSLVAIVDGDPSFWKTHQMSSREGGEALDPLRESAICTSASGAVEPVVVEDVEKDERYSEDAFLQARGIRAYVAAPLRTRSGQAVGTLCVLDTKPRHIGGEELRELQGIASHLMEAIESRPLQAA